MKRIFLLSLAAMTSILSLQAENAAAQPDVVVSIAPVHSLVAGVMEGVGVPELLYSPGQSPHTAPLTPSKVRAIHNADLLVWTGVEMEVSLARILAGSDAGITRSLDEVPGLVKLPARSGGRWDHGHDHGEDTSISDPHTWLSGVNAQEMVVAFAKWLAEVDPGHAATYSTNADRITLRIQRLEGQIRSDLEPVSSIPYLVFHDAYQYFEHDYSLGAMGSVSASPDRIPGARRVQEFHRLSTEGNIQCVFVEPQFEPDLVQTIVGGSGVRIGILDPIGSAHEPGPELWFRMMTDLSRSLQECLTGES